MSISMSERMLLRLQCAIAYLCLPFIFLGLNLWVRFNGYQIANLQQIRQTYRNLLKSGQAPQVICANHLSYVDSLLIAYALGDLLTFLRFFPALPWNLPKKTNVTACWYYPLICYVGKCLQLPAHQSKARTVLQRTQWLLAAKHSVLLFPEGTRSDDGFINTDNVGYGVGELIYNAKAQDALLIYLRGEQETGKSKYPKKNQKFYFAMKTQSFNFKETGRRAKRQIAQDVILNLKQLEVAYFERRQ